MGDFCRGSKALVTALTESDFLPGENAGPETEHTVIGAISFYGVTTYLVPELWEKRLQRFPGRSESKGAMMFKPSHGMSVEEIKKLVSADQHLKAIARLSCWYMVITTLSYRSNFPSISTMWQKSRDIDVELVEVKNAGHGFKPVQGTSNPPSMTWDETQQLVVRHVLEWIQ